MKSFLQILCLFSVLCAPLYSQSNRTGWTAVDLSGSITSGASSLKNASTNFPGGPTFPATDGVTSAPPPSITIAPGSGPAAGYLPLSLFGISAIAGMGDDSVRNFTVPNFRWAGQTWNKMAVTSNGYVVVGTSSTATFSNVALPNASAPRNMFAPLWTNLNPTLGGAVRIGTLTDGAHTWIVVDWAGVRNAVSPETNSVEIWVRINDIEEVVYSYGHVTPGNGGLVTIGAQDTTGTVGATWCLNGSPSPPVSTTELVVKSRFPISAAPNPLDLGNVKVGTSSMSNIVVSNPTHTALKILSIAIGGPDASIFTMPPDTTPISPGGNRSFSVTCSPLTVGLKNAWAIFL